MSSKSETGDTTGMKWQAAAIAALQEAAESYLAHLWEDAWVLNRSFPLICWSRAGNVMTYFFGVLLAAISAQSTQNGRL